MGIRIDKKPFVGCIGVAWALFQLYTGFFGILGPLQQRSIHVAFALVLTFLLYPISSKLDKDKI